MSLLEIDRLILFSKISIITNIDVLIIDILPNNSKHLIDFINNILSTFYFINILDTLKIDNYKDITLDPANFFYYQGIKFLKS